MTTTASEEDVLQVEGTLQRIASDLSMITDRNLELEPESLKVDLLEERPAGRGSIHISFKLGVKKDDSILHGALLVPLPDAISLACYMMMIPDEGVKGKRSLKTLDNLTKDAMMEVGNFIGGASDAALRGLMGGDVIVRSEGCQGVKANTRPCFSYEEGESLLVGRGKLTLHDYPAFEVILVLPRFE